ncbi:MAG: NAD(P)/FAD-dependent oxidoreductase [Methanolinea sp.]|nr:NAD(P)/FAD-dependent oxidoreductase [Methanolinea sp.]
MKICIIGGGLTGLVAAFFLGRDHEIDLYEKRRHLGGCVSSYEVGDTHIEAFYHHCFASDTHLFSLMKSLGVLDRLEWLKGTTGYYVDGRIYPLNTPHEILSYPYLSLADKARLALLTVRSRRLDTARLDDITAREFVTRELGERVYSSFFEPLLSSKFGDCRDAVSAAWLVSRIAIRSNRGISGERLGYLQGGFHTLVEALAEKIGNDCVIRLGDPVTSLSRDTGGWRVNDRRYDAVVSTIPPQALPAGVVTGLGPVPYQGAACMLLAMDRDVTDGIYWLNMKDPAPYGAVISHTNFIPAEKYGQHLVYLASYFSGTLPGKIDETMLADFCSRFRIPSGDIAWHRMSVEPFAGPLYTRGFYHKIVPYQAEGLYFAGMFSKPNYPERSMNGSVAAGMDVARLIGTAGGA